MRGRSRRWPVTFTMALLLYGLVVPVGGSLLSREASAAEAPGFEALATPQRLLDTRPDQSTADGNAAGGGMIAARSTLSLTVAERVGLPPSMGAIVLNVTVTEPAGHGFVTVFPCGEPVPTASNVNYRPGQTVPNAVISGVGSDGSVCFYTHAATHLIVDVSGWFPAAAYTPLDAPQRLADTRSGRPTADGAFAGEGLLAGGRVLELEVAGRAGIDESATAVALNVTATEAAGPGFVVVYPCGVARPLASNLNYAGGDTVPNLVVSKIGTDGRVCLYSHAAVHLVVDVAGAFADVAYSSLTAPRRLLDTRAYADGTLDGSFWGAGAQPPRSTLQLQVAGRGEVPDDASAVVLNVTAVNPAAPGFLTMHPRGTSRPNASNVNFLPGDVVANAVVARVGGAGEICLFTYAATDVVVDVAGWFSGPAPADTGAPCPSVSTGAAGAANQLVRYAAEHRAVGTDRIAVLACKIEGFPGADHPPPAAEVAAWANANVTPWFEAASRGRYHPVFEAHPAGTYTISGPGAHPDWCAPFRLDSFSRHLCTIGELSPEICAREDSPPTGPPFTNLVMYTDGGYLSSGTPGTFFPDDAWTVLDRSPDESRRGVTLKAATFDARTWVHEIGHSLHWPHSYIGEGEVSDQYDNPLDIMSEFVGDTPQHTLAFNRLASGWIDDSKVVIHRSGQANYTLDEPTGSGLQLLALPSNNDPWRILTIEARPTTGFDGALARGGVVVHRVDQSGDGGPCDIICLADDLYGKVSTFRRHQQAVGAANSYDHVLEVGQSTTIDGVTVSVTGVDGSRYRIEVAGTYTDPPGL